MVAIGPAFASPYSPLSLIPKNTRPDEAKLDKARKASNARRVHPQAASEGRARPPGARKTSSSTSFPLPPSLSPSPPSCSGPLPLSFSLSSPSHNFCRML